MTRFSIHHTTIAAAVAALVSAAAPAFAADPYDGTWVLDFPSQGYIDATGGWSCPALRLPFQVHDGQVVANFERLPMVNGIMVEAGEGAAAAPVTGTVASDGSVNAMWQGYHATGKLAATSGTITIKGECGPRVGQALRVSD